MPQVKSQPYSQKLTNYTKKRYALSAPVKTTDVRIGVRILLADKAATHLRGFFVSHVFPVMGKACGASSDAPFASKTVRQSVRSCPPVIGVAAGFLGKTLLETNHV